MPKQDTSDEVRPADILAVKVFCKTYPSFPEGGVRWQMFNEETNEFKGTGAFLKFRGRRYIDVPRYFAVLRGTRRAA